MTRKARVVERMRRDRRIWFGEDEASGRGEPGREETGFDAMQDTRQAEAREDGREGRSA